MKKPKFSIVIALAPWRDAEIRSSIRRLKYPKSRYEVIIIKGLNVPDNRNEGVKRANGDIIVFLDDDGIIEPDYLNKLDAFLSAHPEVDIVGGPQLNPPGEGLFAQISGYALGSSFGAFGINKRYKKVPENLSADSNYISGANFISKKKVFYKLSFDREIYPADDVNFINEARENSFKVAYSPDIVIYHRRRATFNGLVQQIFDYGRARTNLHVLKHTIYKPFFLIPSLFIIYLLILPFIISLSLLFAMPLIFYFSLSILMALYESIMNKEVFAFPILPGIFFAIHISYGLGLIYGLFRNIFKLKSTN